MQNILTQSDIRAYHQRGVKVITLPEAPLLTDCARDELKRLGMQVLVDNGAGMAAQPIFAQQVQLRYPNHPAAGTATRACRTSASPSVPPSGRQSVRTGS